MCCRLAVWVLLNGNPSGCLVWLAVVCSSFCCVNVGTSKRSPTTPWGNTDLGYVNLGNCLLSRAILLIKLATCLGYTWVIEQPGGSLLPWYPRFERHVWKVRPMWHASWWARHYKALTPSLGFKLENTKIHVRNGLKNSLESCHMKKPFVRSIDLTKGFLI